MSSSSLPKEAQTFEGLVENVFFHNEDNGFTVFLLSEANQNKKSIVCTGTLPSLMVGEKVKVNGSYVKNPKYGLQLNVDRLEKSEPTTLEDIERYLGTGVITGIGKAMAKRIVEKFGEQTLEVFAEEPERLAEIKGITFEKAAKMGTVFHEKTDERRAMLFLQNYDISPTFATRIYKKFGEATAEIVKKNPYRLADEISGIGFRKADAIANKVGIAFDSDVRVKAGLKFCLSNASTQGHVYLPKKVLVEDAAELLQIPIEQVLSAFAELSMERVFCLENLPGDEVAVYMNAFFYAENYVAKKILDLSGCVESTQANTDSDIEEIESETNMPLADNQKLAVKESIKSGVLVVTGGPGTGKTTTLNTIIKLMQKKGLEIELAAPTGRAARRMSETTGLDAKTIHRLLEISYLVDDPKRQTFNKNEDNPIEADVIIIDESSMVDILLMQHLLKAIAPGTRLIMVGDADQLPSVGPGNVLRDIINSDCVNVVRLTEIFRQAQESAIVMNAHRINRGEYPSINEKSKDFFFIKKSSTDDTVRTIVELVIERLPAYLNCDMFTDIQVLTPMRKSIIGVNNLNEELQQNMNPPMPSKSEKESREVVFREGDKVMQIKNNYSASWRVISPGGAILEKGMGVFNGDQGCIQEINNENEYVLVKFDDERVVEYGFNQLDELELSFAVTIHKSQGSEYKAVVIPVHSGPPMLMSKNLLYTAVTRAKELVVIVGTEEMLRRMISNNKETRRYTFLANRLSQGKT